MSKFYLLGTYHRTFVISNTDKSQSEKAACGIVGKTPTMAENLKKRFPQPRKPFAIPN
jgi:hypothetical protein